MAAIIESPLSSHPACPRINYYVNGILLSVCSQQELNLGIFLISRMKYINRSHHSSIMITRSWTMFCEPTWSKIKCYQWATMDKQSDMVYLATINKSSHWTDKLVEKKSMCDWQLGQQRNTIVISIILLRMCYKCSRLRHR